MQYTLDARILQAVIDYLKTKPYVEVAELIGAILKDAKPVEQPEPGANDDV